MRYEDNPFNILHVSMRDSQEKILDKVEDLSLTLDEALCSQASSILTNPTKRIEAEVSWFPGYTPKKIKEALEDAKATPDEFIDNFSEDELSYADVNAEILAFLNIPYPNMLKDYLLKIASDLENVDTDALFNELNKERNVAGIPAIPNIDILNTAVQNRKRDIAESIHIKLKKIDDIEKRIEILTYVVENDTSNGKIAPSSVIKDIIEKYEIDIQETLNYTASKVETLGTFVEMDLDRGDEAKIDEGLQLYERQLKTWDRIAQPIQVLMQSQGLEHAASKEMAHSVRQLALKLYNEHGQLDASKRLINLMKTVFAEVLTVAEKTEEDTIILNRISNRDSIFNKAISRCKEVVDDVKSAPTSGFANAEKLRSEFERMLDTSIRATFKNPNNIDPNGLDRVAELSDIYINAMLACIIAYGNATKEWGECETFLDTLSKYAVNPKTLDAINKNRKILLDNIAEKKLYGDMEPISSAPSLHTVNGCGFILYGHSEPIDFNILEHTYVSTLYFVFFYIPIFPIARYRVSSNYDGSYRFYGKLPLTTGNIVHIIISLILIVLAISWFSDPKNDAQKRAFDKRYSYTLEQKFNNVNYKSGLNIILPETYSFN